MQRRLELDQLPPGHQRVEGRLLERDADLPPDRPRVLRDVEAGHLRPPPGGPEQGGQHPHGGRLAGAVRPEEPVDLSLGHLEVDAVDGLDAALELARQLVRLDRGHVRAR